MKKPPWTQARWNAYVKGVLRNGTIRYPPRYEVLNAAKRGKQVNISTGRIAEHYECAECHGLFPATMVVVDHIEPVVPVSGFTNWHDVVIRMYCPASGMQVLCKPCHKVKSNEENALRKSNNKNNKDSNEQL